MNTPFGAGPQAIGYLYQIQYALLTLLKADDHEENAVIIEGLDDVELNGASFFELQQLKHHIDTKRQATLANTSPDLWKSIRVWSEGLKEKRWDPLQTKLTLITTAKAVKGSIAFKLRDSSTERNTDDALKELINVANTSKSQELKELFDIFKSLKPNQQKQLVEAVVIVDNAPTMLNLEEPIKNKLRLKAPKERLEHVYQALLGWWYATAAIQLWHKSRNPIKWIEMKTELDDIVNQYKEDRLPTTFARAEPDEAFYKSQEGRGFVRQLDFLMLQLEEVRYAVKDYYRAFNERTKWGTEKLLIGREMEGYEADLKEQWHRFVLRLKRNPEFAGRFDDDAACIEFGQRVLEWVDSQNVAIRTGMPSNSGYITRGSYHIMADKDEPPVYWHPKFLEKLDAIAKETIDSI